jgi:hypothetical protein
MEPVEAVALKFVRAVAVTTDIVAKANLPRMQIQFYQRAAPAVVATWIADCRKPRRSMKTYPSDCLMWLDTQLNIMAKLAIEDMTAPEG